MEKKLSVIKAEKEALETQIIQLELQLEEDKLTRKEDEKRLKEALETQIIQLELQLEEDKLTRKEDEKRLKEALETQIIQLELQLEEDKIKRREDKKKLKEEIIQLRFKRDALKKSNHEQLTRIEKLTRKQDTTRRKNEEVIKELEEKIKILKAENEVLRDPKELIQLREKNTQLSIEIAELDERVRKDKSNCKRLQEKLDEYITCKRRKCKGTKVIVPCVILYTIKKQYYIKW